MERLLDVRDMRVSFRSGKTSVEAIRGASFHVNEKEIMAIVGESGSGKSVLTQSCLRLIASPPGQIDGGEVWFCGRDLMSLSESQLQRVRGREISVIFQDAMTALNPTMKIGDQITEMLLQHLRMTRADARALAEEILPLREEPEKIAQWLQRNLRSSGERLAEDTAALSGFLREKEPRGAIEQWLLQRGAYTRAQAREEAVRLLASVKIPDPQKRIDQYIFQCSGGMRQRVMIAMALSCRPRLVIADEPTTALDVTIKAEILDLLAQLIRSLGTSIILITHDLGTVASCADRIGVMYGGQFMEQGTSREIFYETLHPYTLGLLQAMPRLDLPRGGALSTIPGNPPNLNRMPSGCPFSTRCRYCMAVCKEQQPPQAEWNGHTVRCWLYDPRAARQKELFDAEKERLHVRNDA